MTKRLFSTLLAVFMTLGMFFLAAPNASAYTEHATSEDAIQFIKDWEGFSPKAFWDVSQWTVGYGTAGVKGQTMTEEQADAAMRAHLALVDKAINQFASSKGLNLTQSQHDALVSFSFNCGTAWMRNTGRLVSAVAEGKSGNEFLFALCLWSNVAGSPDVGVMKRRLSEANVYLNGAYNKSVPSDFSYVIFDANGGVNGHGGEDKMQGYITETNAPVLAANPTREGYSFFGWFTEKEGGTKVDALNASTRGKALYARWGAEVKVTQDANVRSGAGVANSVTGSVKKGETLAITLTKTVDGAVWGQFDKGWVALMYTDFKGAADAPTFDAATATVIAKGSVTCDTYVNIRKDAGTASAVVATVTNGTKVSIYEKKTVSGRPWGKLENGWICLDYVSLEGQTPDEKPAETTVQSTTAPETTETTTAPTEPPKAAEGKVGVVNTNGLNVRSGAGVENAKVATLNKGAKVTVYEQVTAASAPWGKIESGWVCMYYIDLESDKPTEPVGQTVATGRVSSSTQLNVRGGAGTDFPRVSSLNPGTKVYIYELKTVDGQKWGRMDEKNWICLTYVTLEEAEEKPTQTPVTEPTTAPTEPETTQTQPTTAPTLPQTTPTNPAETKPAQKGNPEGSVSSSTALNVRAGAGTTFPTVGMLSPGTKVTILEQSSADGLKWGRIGDSRWVCMSYITITGEVVSEPSEAVAKGRVNSTTNLNVRSGAGVGNALVGKLTPGETVSIYETVKVGSTWWGRTDTGWVSMDYLEILSGSLG